MPGDYYVYGHINPITNKFFYIGKGKGKRWASKSGRNTLWNYIVNRYGFFSVKLVDGLTDEQACEIEIQYIKKYGCNHNGGILVNIAPGGNGGAGFDLSVGPWNKGKKGIYSNETIEKLRLSRLGKKLPPDQKIKVLAGLKKAGEARLKKMLRVKCLVTGDHWDNRNHCMQALSMNLKVFQQRIWKNSPTKGHHLQYIKTK